MSKEELSDWLYNYCAPRTGFYPTEKAMEEMAQAILAEFEIKLKVLP